MRLIQDTIDLNDKRIKTKPNAQDHKNKSRKKETKIKVSSE